MNLTKLHVMRVCRSCADPAGRRALLSPVAGCVCCALHCAWHGDNSCRWGTLQTGLKLPEEAFLAPFLSAHWTSTGELKGAAWEERTAGEAEAKQLLTWGRSLVTGVKLRSAGGDKQGLPQELLPLDRLPWKQELSGRLWTKPRMRPKRTGLLRRFAATINGALRRGEEEMTDVAS